MTQSRLQEEKKMSGMQKLNLTENGYASRLTLVLISQLNPVPGYHRKLNSPKRLKTVWCRSCRNQTQRQVFSRSETSDRKINRTRDICAEKAKGTIAWRPSIQALQIFQRMNAMADVTKDIKRFQDKFPRTLYWSQKSFL